MSSSQASHQRRNLSPLALTGIVLGLIFILACLCIGFVAFILINAGRQIHLSPGVPSLVGTQTPAVVRPTLSLQDNPDTSTPGAQATPQSKGQQSTRLTPSIPLPSSETLSILEDTHIPLSDPIELARRLGGIDALSRTIEPPEYPLQVGALELFWVGDMDTNDAFQVEAALSYITEHAYFWIQAGVAYDENDLQILAQIFEEQIYPTTRNFFGSEWTPGVDGDPHLYILYARGLGDDLAGYYSATDEYPPLVHEYSNAHELFVFNADIVRLDDPYTYGVLAHEFQHMILWNRDRNEASWLNEGLSELAAFINGYYDGGFDRLYARNPDIQLNDWPNHHSGTGSHYGASFLFLNYFMGRFGVETTQELVAYPEDGLSGVDGVLAQSATYDPHRGKIIETDELFLDWSIASYLNDAALEDGRYAYPLYPEAPRPSVAESIYDCPTDVLTRDVAQYGVDYIRIACKGEHTLRFEGSIQVGLLPTDPHSGSHVFWSNKGDEANMTLTRQFDFSSLSAPLSLSYWTWYDLEVDYDYLYLLASRDGENWQILTTPSGTAQDPSGNSFGWAYNGVSGRRPPASWIQETVDISQFAGETVYLRFEYVTDAAVNGEGFLLDDVAISQAGYYSDFEDDNGGWESNGWVRIQNALPQTFQLALITFGETTRVEYLELGSDLALEIPLSIGNDVAEVVLVVAGTTRFTRQRAAYRFSILP